MTGVELRRIADEQFCLDPVRRHRRGLAVGSASAAANPDRREPATMGNAASAGARCANARTRSATDTDRPKRAAIS